MKPLAWIFSDQRQKIQANLLFVEISGKFYMSRKPHIKRICRIDRPL
jgi:hypothetical protein